jgi:hypothetical protein
MMAHIILLCCIKKNFAMAELISVFESSSRTNGLCFLVMSCTSQQINYFIFFYSSLPLLVLKFGIWLINSYKTMCLQKNVYQSDNLLWLQYIESYRVRDIVLNATFNNITLYTMFIQPNEWTCIFGVGYRHWVWVDFSDIMFGLTFQTLSLGWLFRHWV